MNIELNIRHYSMASLLITMLLCLSSCSDDSSDNVVPQHRITFATPVISNMSRGVLGEIPGTTYDKNETFILAMRRYPEGQYQKWDRCENEMEYVNLGDVNAADVIKWNETYQLWYTKESHYWRTGWDYVMGAVSPACLRTSNYIESMYYGATGLAIRGYVTPPLGSQYDIMYVERTYGKNLVNSGVNGVDLQFKHLLSSIHFKVGVSPEYVKEMHDNHTPLKEGDLKITSIKMTGFTNKARFQENIDEDRGHKSNPEWKLNSTEPGTDKVYSFLPATITLPVEANITADEAAVDITAASYGGYSALFIPQYLDANAKVTINWIKKGTAGTTTLVLNDGIRPYTEEWLMGKRYTYTIMFKSNMIYFSPNVTDMEKGDIDIL